MVEQQTKPDVLTIEQTVKAKKLLGRASYGVIYTALFGSVASEDCTCENPKECNCIVAQRLMAIVMVAY